VATSCSICGETLQSQGAAGLHALVAHLNPEPPPPLPCAGAGGVGGEPGLGPVGALGPPRARPGAGGRVVMVVALGAIAAVLSGALVAFLVGRGGGSSAPAEEVAASVDGLAPASAPAGLRTVSKPDQGFSIDLPESLTELPLTADGLVQSVDPAKSLDPAVAGVVEASFDVFAEGLRLYALDGATGDAQLVQGTTVKPGKDIDDVPRAILDDQYRELGAVSTDWATVELPAGDALVVSVQGAMGSPTVPIVQYILVEEGHLWMLTSFGPSAVENADEIAKSFRVL
jgi:hypothetical protein